MSQVKQESFFLIKGVNKLGAFLAWVAPKSISEKIAKGIYE